MESPTKAIAVTECPISDGSRVVAIASAFSPIAPQLARNSKPPALPWKPAGAKEKEKLK